MNKEYRVFCKCIKDIVKFVECKTCPHFNESDDKFCTYVENDENIK